MKKVGVIGTRGSIKKSAFLNTDNLLHKVGANTGNLLFQYAVCDSLDEEFLVIGEDLEWNVKQVQQHCRVLVIPSANFIRENFDFSGFVDFLDKCNLPLVFVGLGAQAKDYTQDSFDFHPSILRLISLIKERSSQVGIRGEFTLKVLDKYGVNNAVVTGCPTNFINRDPKFTKKLQNKWNKETFSFMATGDEPWPKDLRKRDAERKMIEWVCENNGLFIQQSVAPFVKYSRQSNLYQTEDVPEHHENSLRRSLAPNMTNDEFRAFVATRLRIYYSVDQWMEDAAKVDFSIGLRLHGNMAAWQSGTPAIWIYHDSRTRELAETMSLPMVSFENFIESDSLSQLKESVEFDFQRYEDRRNELRGRLSGIYSKEGIKHNYGNVSK